MTASVPGERVAPGWTVELFGGVSAIHQERVIRRFRTQKTASLLAYLAYNKTQRHPREKLADLLWPDNDPHDSRMSLNVAVCALKQALELPDSREEVVLSTRGSIQLNPELVSTDTAAFMAAREYALHLEEPERRITALQEAIKLYRAEPLAGLYDEWVLAVQRQFAQIYYQLLLEVTDHHLAAGASRHALDYAWQALQADPLAEEGHIRVMRAYVAMKQPVAAIQRYRDYQETLRRETGGAPSPALARFAAEIERQPIEMLPPQRGEQAAQLPSTPAGWVTILYRRDCPDDTEAAERLAETLSRSGRQVFIDRDSVCSPQRSRLIESRIRTSESIVLLLSPAGLKSEMLTYEAGIALEALQECGRPRVIGLSIGTDVLPELPIPFSHMETYCCGADHAAISSVAHDVLTREDQRAQRLSTFESLGGLVPMNSSFYIVREGDDSVRSALARREGLVLIKGPRQTGKSSLLSRAAQQAQDSGSRIAITDLSSFGAQDLKSPGALYLAMAESLMSQVETATPPDDVWDARRTPSWNLERFLKSQVLSRASTPFVWLIDEADRLFACPFGTEVFALFRSWYNTRAALSKSPWLLLSVVMAYASETRLFIANPALSPFNIGVQVRLEEFSLAEASELNRRYQSPLSEREVARLHGLVGGHPHLVRLGLQEIALQGLTLAQFEIAAGADDGLYGDHLRRMHTALVRDVQLMTEVRRVIAGGSCSSIDAFYRLRTAGVLSGSDARQCRIRCPLYANYLRRCLP